MSYLQQGDCLLKTIDDFPANWKLLKTDLLHKGQSNHHRLKGGRFRIVTDGEKIFVKVLAATKLTHEEHKPISLKKGYYALEIVNEYDHFSEESRQVVD